MHGVNNNVKFDIQNVPEIYFNKNKYDFLIILIVDNVPIYNPTISIYYFCFQTHNSVLNVKAM
jgi:hypothetical protein